MKKKLAVVLALVLVMALSIAGTYAYLTSKDTVVNTFTVGNVQIKLDEAKVTEDGKPVEGADRVKANTYHLLPGHEYKKDPTVTVLKGSEESYVRMLVTVSDMAKLQAAFPKADYPDFYKGDLFLLQKLVTGWDKDTWKSIGYSNGTYEFRYKTTVEPSDDLNLVLPALFTGVSIPGDVDNTALANLQNAKITIVAQAIQADGFDTADLAWAEWE